MQPFPPGLGAGGPERGRRATGEGQPAAGSAMEALGYDRDCTLVQEDDRPVRLAVKRVPGWSLVALDRATNTVTLPPGVSLDLAATAKALAADRAAHTPARAAECGILVSLGGDTAVAGEPGRRLAHPRPRDGPRRRPPDPRHPHHGRHPRRRPRHLRHHGPPPTPRQPAAPPHRRPPHRPARRHGLAHRLGRRGHLRRRRHHRRPGEGRHRTPLALPPGPPGPARLTRGDGCHDSGLVFLPAPDNPRPRPDGFPRS